MDSAADQLPLLLSGIAMLATAVGLIVLDPRGVPTRALATLLAVRGLSNIDVHVFTHSLAMRNVDEAIEAVVWCAGVAFLLVWPRRRLHGRWPFYVLGAVSVVLFGALLVWAEFAFSFTAGEIGLNYTSASGYGPLSIFNSIQQLVYGAIGVVCAWSFLRGGEIAMRRPNLLVALGFALTTAIHVGIIARELAGTLVVVDEWHRVYLALREVSAELTLACALLLVAAALRHREGRGLALVSAAVLVAASALSAALALLAGTAASITLDALLKLSIPGLVGYAVLKHRLFDIDLRLKWTLRRGTVAAIFLGVFFVVAQLAQNFLSESMGWAFGGVVAGVLLFAIAPVQRLAERFADAAMPNVADTPEYRSTRKIEVYCSAIRFALADRIVTRDEERHLMQLATELGIPAADAFRLREETERELGVA